MRVWWLGFAACGGQDVMTSDPLPPPDTDGACGDVTTHDVTLLGAVVLDDLPFEGATIWVEDRGWEPGTILAEGVTGADGTVTFALDDLVSVEDCWGVLLDYVAVASAVSPADGSTLSGETDLNSHLFSAIDSGSLVADFSPFPIELEAVE